MRLSRLITPELTTLLEENPAELTEALEEVHPEDVADIVEELADDRAAHLLTRLPTHYAAQVFERLDEDRQERLVTAMSSDAAAALVVEMDADERADLYSQLPPDMGAELLTLIEEVDPEIAEDVEELARWPETSAGGLMTTDYLWIRPGLFVSDATNELRRRAHSAETIDKIFVLDGDDILVGELTLKQMLLAEPQSRIDDVMVHNVISVPPELDQEDVARKLAKYDLNTMAVVDDGGHLLGVVTSDDILDVLTEEQDEDVQKMNAIEPIREEYFDTTVGVLLRKRAPWLIVLFLGGFGTASAMQANDAVLAAIAQLSFYVPMLVSAGGNSGAQSSTLIIRGLAVGDIRVGDWWRVLGREITLGLLLGTLLASMGFARALFAGDGIDFALLVAVTVVGLVVMGCVIGSMMPLLLFRLGVDPATSSTPFIATLIDVLGILLYLGLARVLLSDMLGRLPAPG